MSEVGVVGEEHLDINNLRIPETEKQNLEKLLVLLRKSAKDKKFKISLDIVGGAVNKEWPRKDIDVALTFEGFLDRESRHARVEGTFKALKDIVNDAVSKSHNQFVIMQPLKVPRIDHEFDNPNIFIHNGSIIVAPLHGVPIEIINNV